MKSVFSLLLLLSLLLSLAACGDASAPAQPQTDLSQPAQAGTALGENQLSSTPGIDIDLTILSRTMVYSEVYNMMMTPENYIGKVVRMHGLCSTFESAAVDGQEARVYYTCIIFDATACCSQGIEFVLAGDVGAEAYPPTDTEITVTGTFQTYRENGILYSHLVDATLE